jgi:site-specific DNA-methyltransferase (adenine-specific)/modification methylase
MIKEIIGAAELYCGDCLDILPTIKCDSLITDPPYNVGKDYGTHKDKMPAEEYIAWMEKIIKIAVEISERQVFIAPRYKMKEFLIMMPKCHIVVVRRGAAGPFREGWSDQFETILMCGKPNKVYKDLWDDIRLKGEGYFFKEDSFDHPGYTPYPIMDRCVQLMSNEIVCDPFMGTGTTGIAAVQNNRKFIGIELDQKWFSLACKRIEDAQRQKNLF